MHLGYLDICLSVKDLKASVAFYQGLGFVRSDGNPKESYAILAKDEVRIGLYVHQEPNMLNFRGANLQDVVSYLRFNGMSDIPEVEEESDGSTGFQISDPDGNILYFNSLRGHDPDPNCVRTDDTTAIVAHPSDHRR